MRVTMPAGVHRERFPFTDRSVHRPRPHRCAPPRPRRRQRQRPGPLHRPSRSGPSRPQPPSRPSLRSPPSPPSATRGRARRLDRRAAAGRPARLHGRRALRTRARSSPPSTRPAPGATSCWSARSARRLAPGRPQAPGRLGLGGVPHPARDLPRQHRDRQGQRGRDRQGRGPLLVAGLRGHLLRRRGELQHLDRPAPRARERLRLAHLRPHRPVRPAGRGRRHAPRRRARPRSPRPALPLLDTPQAPASSPTCSPARSPPRTPTPSPTASPPPG